VVNTTTYTWPDLVAASRRLCLACGEPNLDLFAERYEATLKQVAAWLQRRALGSWRRGRREGKRPELRRCAPPLQRTIAEFWRRWRKAERAQMLPEPLDSVLATRQRHALENIPAMLGMISDHLLEDMIIAADEEFGVFQRRWTDTAVRLTEDAFLAGRIDRVVERNGALVVEKLVVGFPADTPDRDPELLLWALAAEDLVGEADAVAQYDLTTGTLSQSPYDRDLALAALDRAATVARCAARTSGPARDA
jgi:hypothetical protein